MPMRLKDPTPKKETDFNFLICNFYADTLSHDMSNPTGASDLQKVDFFEFTLNNLNEGIVWTDQSGIIVYANETSLKWFGTSKTELIGKPIHQILQDERFEAWLAQLMKNPDRKSAALSVAWNGRKTDIHALVSFAVGQNSYNCFLFKSGNSDEDPNEMLRIISEGTAAVVGGDFFRSLAYHIIISTGIRYAIVTECANIAKTKVRTLVYIERDNFLDNFEYDLTGTPCEIVMRGENYYCTADLDALFPEEEGVKSYFGVPIFLSNGEIIGHIAVFDSKPMSVSEQKLNVLKIFASRAGAEIERKRNEEIVRENMARYKGLFEDSPIGIGEEDLSAIKKHIDILKKDYGEDLQSIFAQHPQEVDACYQRLKRQNANRAQISLFDLDTFEEYLAYLSKSFQPREFIDVILAFDSGAKIFEREIAVRTAAGHRKFLKSKRAILPGSERDWAKTILTCVDITEQKLAEENLKQALAEVEELKTKLEAENIYLQQEIKYEHNFEEIISQSPVFKKVLEKIELVAETDATVLILGESGTGKELIARAIHSISKRGDRPLVKVNCAALPANLIESELFGHEKGAFTGAIAQKIGRFELADGGTLFLDEIGEMPLEIQSKLLRVLQEGEFERVGSSKTMKVDVRVIAATNRDLETSVNSKEFRADLFYRLNVFPISAPPLRGRKEDIPVLVTHFCKKHGARMGKKISSVAKSALDVLMAYNWPGNVRELENVIERGLVIAKSNILEFGDWLPGVNLITEKAPAPISADMPKQALEDVERSHILDILKQTNWKIRGADGAALILAINPTTLEARMKKLGIQRPR
jgi:formate hydrogenlyase transcriptional activator